VRIVGNLPYNISTPLLFHLLRYAARVRDLHFMLQLEVVERHVEDARAKGAVIRCGGRRATELGELFYQPTVLTDVTHEMAIMREETFGPVLPIARVASEDEAVRSFPAAV